MVDSAEMVFCGSSLKYYAGLGRVKSSRFAKGKLKPDCRLAIGCLKPTPGYFRLF
jgi:hypothetical protein